MKEIKQTKKKLSSEKLKSKMKVNKFSLGYMVLKIKSLFKKRDK